MGFVFPARHESFPNQSTDVAIVDSPAEVVLDIGEGKGERVVRWNGTEALSDEKGVPKSVKSFKNVMLMSIITIL